jgi:plastocyanin
VIRIKRAVKLILPLALVASLSLMAPTSAQTQGKDAAASTKTVKMLDFKFSPKTITVSKGTTIKWVNKGAAAHNTKGPGFNSGNVPAGKSYSHKFNSSGTFKYVCTYHKSQGMTGKIIVS